MEDYKVIIDNEKYHIPGLVSSFNQEIFQEYSYEEENEKYFDMNRLIDDDKIPELDRICDMCCDTIGQITLDNENDLKEFSSLGADLRMYDNLSKISFKRGDKEKGINYILQEMKIALEYYNVLLERDKENTKTK